MNQYIKSISRGLEFFIVIIVAFGFSILASVISVLNPELNTPITNSQLEFLLVYESLVIIVLGVFLSMRGWSFRKLGLIPTLKDTGIGILIAFVGYLFYTVIWSVSGSFVPDLEQQADNLVAPGLELATVLAVSVLNPVYEELFVCGYAIAALREGRGSWFAINVSVWIRLIYHLYQGTTGVISIIPLGILFAYWYARTGRLWPVFIAHGIFDLTSLLVYVQT